MLSSLMSWDGKWSAQEVYSGGESPILLTVARPQANISFADKNTCLFVA